MALAPCPVFGDGRDGEEPVAVFTAGGFRRGEGWEMREVETGVGVAMEWMKLLRAWRLRTGVERVREGFFEGV